MITMSEFEVRRHAKAFVDIYLKDGNSAAGKYGLENMVNPSTATEDDLAFWQGEVKKEFLRQGYELKSDEEGHIEPEVA
jgi:hypothetical protein